MHVDRLLWDGGQSEKRERNARARLKSEGTMAAAVYSEARGQNRGRSCLCPSTSAATLRTHQLEGRPGEKEDKGTSREKDVEGLRDDHTQEAERMRRSPVVLLPSFTSCSRSFRTTTTPLSSRAGPGADSGFLTARPLWPPPPDHRLPCERAREPRADSNCCNDVTQCARKGSLRGFAFAVVGLTPRLALHWQRLPLGARSVVAADVLATQYR